MRTIRISRNGKSGFDATCHQWFTRHFNKHITWNDSVHATSHFLNSFSLSLFLSLFHSVRALVYSFKTCYFNYPEQCKRKKWAIKIERTVDIYEEKGGQESLGWIWRMIINWAWWIVKTIRVGSFLLIFGPRWRV